MTPNKRTQKDGWSKGTFTTKFRTSILLDEDLEKFLKKESKKSGSTMNSFINQSLSDFFGLEGSRKSIEEANDNYLRAVKNKDIHFEGVPCRKEGHTLRYTRQRSCVECKLQYDQTQYRQSNSKRKTYHQSPEVLAKKRKTSKEWYHVPKNKKSHNDGMNEYAKKRYKNDPTYRCFALIRGSLNKFLKQVGTIKEDRTHEIVGYTPKEWYDHLESLFQGPSKDHPEGMTWDNQGRNGWEIDHVKPQSWFTKEQVKECFALSNLKPEWAEWNAWKSNRFVGSSEEFPMPKKAA
jgi:hypothetical protein